MRRADLKVRTTFSRSPAEAGHYRDPSVASPRHSMRYPAAIAGPWLDGHNVRRIGPLAKETVRAGVRSEWSETPEGPQNGVSPTEAGRYRCRSGADTRWRFLKRIRKGRDVCV